MNNNNQAKVSVHVQEILFIFCAGLLGGAESVDFYEVVPELNHGLECELRCAAQPSPNSQQVDIFAVSLVLRAHTYPEFGP